MRAVVFDAYGPSTALVTRDIAEPAPGAGELKVKVAAASLNPIDWKLRSGMMKAVFPVEFPAVLGSDVSGEVVALGEGASGFSVGDKVMGTVKRGYAEFVTAPARNFALVPKGVDPRDAAALPVVALTGTQLIEDTANVQSGETVLVTGAVGGVGRFAVYAALARGAKVIAGVRRSQQAEANKLGAHSVVAIDDETAMTELPELDVLADTIAGPTQQKLTARVKKGGRVVSTVGPPPGDPSRGVIGKGMQSKADGKRLGELAKALAEGKVRLPIAKRFPLEQAAAAHQFAEHGGVGKVLLTV